MLKLKDFFLAFTNDVESGESIIYCICNPLFTMICIAWSLCPVDALYATRIVSLRIIVILRKQGKFV